MAPRVTRRTFLQVASALALPHLALAACGDNRILRIRREADFATFDPANVSGEDEVIALNLFAPLVRYKKRKDNTSAWEWQKHMVGKIGTCGGSDRSYRFDVRKGETWSEGGDVTAEDVKFSFERIAGLTNPKIAANNRALWGNLDKVIVSTTIQAPSCSALPIRA